MVAQKNKICLRADTTLDLIHREVSLHDLDEKEWQLLVKRETDLWEANLKVVDRLKGEQEDCCADQYALGKSLQGLLGEKLHAAVHVELLWEVKGADPDTWVNISTDVTPQYLAKNQNHQGYLTWAATEAMPLDRETVQPQVQFRADLVEQFVSEEDAEQDFKDHKNMQLDTLLGECLGAWEWGLPGKIPLDDLIQMEVDVRNEIAPKILKEIEDLDAWQEKHLKALQEILQDKYDIKVSAQDLRAYVISKTKDLKEWEDQWFFEFPFQKLLDHLEHLKALQVLRAIGLDVMDLDEYIQAANEAARKEMTSKEKEDLLKRATEALLSEAQKALAVLDDPQKLLRTLSRGFYPSSIQETGKKHWEEMTPQERDAYLKEYETLQKRWDLWNQMEAWVLESLPEKTKEDIKDDKEFLWEQQVIDWLEKTEAGQSNMQEENEDTI
jgi:hypothetical protein